MNEINKVAMDRGIYFPGPEHVTLRIEITAAEKEEFSNNEELSSNDNIWWEFETNQFDKEILILTYSEPDKTYEQVETEVKERMIEMKEYEDIFTFNEDRYRITRTTIIVNCKTMEEKHNFNIKKYTAPEGTFVELYEGEEYSDIDETYFLDNFNFVSPVDFSKIERITYSELNGKIEILYKSGKYINYENCHGTYR